MRLRLFCLGLVLLLTFGLAGHAPAEPKPGGTLVIISSQVPRHFNPAVQSGTATAVPGTQLFATPLRFDNQWQPHPYLAKSWNIADDGLSVTLELVDGATFHDGKPVTSEDVAFSVQTVQANHPFKSMFSAVEKVDTPNPQTAILRLSKPHPAIQLAMSSALLPIIPKHIYGDGQDAKTHPRNSDPVGSGPFKFVEYKRGEHVILERNENFFIPGRPYLDRIIIKIIRDASSRVIALERGEGHIGAYTESRDIKRLQKQEHLMVTSKGFEAVGPITWLAFNTAKPPLDDVRVRKAISYAIDRNFIRNALHAGLSKPATGPIAPDSPYYTGEVELYKVDLDKANALLDEAGHARGEGGVRFQLTVDHIPAVVEQQKVIAEYLRPQLKKAGIEVEVRNAPDFPTWAKRVSNHEFDLTMDIVFNWGDPVIGVHRTYLCDNIRKGVIWSNTQSYCNQKVDELLEQAGQEMDPEKRKALYAEFQKIVVDELPLAWINVLPYYTAIHKGLANPPLTIWGMMAPMDELYWENPPK
ncbi:MAG: peptide ABC transporter substrate-binding protein [Candidatus Entotheonella gemina]|uniref:Peptide ABC transporter substrate-binding protein n=2 Tax=Candidatus Entotheonella TaxID=93171 RepID=W4LZI3_9BACT|nr:MAG: peptide ABC transporter substrate-binding protein [Candidatus Entotheonella gemina]